MRLIWYAGRLLQRMYSPFSFRSCSSRGAVIPEDLFIEILLRVPAEFVPKFRVLSKFYRDLIDSREFRQKHTELSIKRTACSHIILNQKAGVNNCTVLKLDPTTIDKELEDLINSSKRNDYFIVGSCVGILCLKLKYSSKIILWNPLTEGSRSIPAAKNGLPNTSDRFYSTYFFGHDSVTDDLKILKISHKDLRLNEPGDYDCEIYSSNAGSWRLIVGDDNDYPTLHLYSGGIFVEGTNSTHIVDHTSGEDIVAFSFSSDKFHKIPLPTECAWLWREHATVSSLDGCLCIYSSAYNWSIWVMKKYGVKESWTKLFSIDDFSISGLYPIPLQFVNDGRQLLLLTTTPEAVPEEYKMRVYDFQAKKFTRNRMISSIELRTPKHFLYTPSIKSLGQSHHLYPIRTTRSSKGKGYRRIKHILSRSKN